MRFPLVFALAVTSSLWLSESWAQEPSAPPQPKPTATDEPPTALSQPAPGAVASTYVDGKLTVKARNARLIDVLYSVCDLIGAQLNVPEDADQLILRAVGPARPRDVLVSLLRGSPFNYSMSGSADDPNAIVSVTVFPKDKKGGNDKEADSPSPAQQLRELTAQAQAALGDSGTDNATEGMGSDVGNADSPSTAASSPLAQSFLKALEADPNLISKLEARINDDGTAADAAANSASDQPAAPAPVTPSLGRRGRHL